jgi:hypothetical protein
MLDLFDLAPKDRLVAQLLLSQGIMKMDDFRIALERTKESFFFSLAEVIVGHGVVTLQQLEDILHDYCRKLRLGELAVARGLITEEQLDLALSVQSDREMRIGEVFVELHLATPDQIDLLLNYQQTCRVEATAC